MLFSAYQSYFVFLSRSRVQVPARIYSHPVVAWTRKPSYHVVVTRALAAVCAYASFTCWLLYMLCQSSSFRVSCTLISACIAQSCCTLCLSAGQPVRLMRFSNGAMFQWPIVWSAHSAARLTDIVTEERAFCWTLPRSSSSALFWSLERYSVTPGTDVGPSFYHIVLQLLFCQSFE